MKNAKFAKYKGTLNIRDLQFQKGHSIERVICRYISIQNCSSKTLEISVSKPCLLRFSTAAFHFLVRVMQAEEYNMV